MDIPNINQGPTSPFVFPVGLAWVRKMNIMVVMLMPFACERTAGGHCCSPLSLGKKNFHFCILYSFDQEEYFLIKSSLKFLFLYCDMASF